MVQKIAQKELDEKTVAGKFFVVPKGLSMGKVLAKYRIRTEEVPVKTTEIGEYYPKENSYCNSR